MVLRWFLQAFLILHLSLIVSREENDPFFSRFLASFPHLSLMSPCRCRCRSSAFASLLESLQYRISYSPLKSGVDSDLVSIPRACNLIGQSLMP